MARIGELTLVRGNRGLLLLAVTAGLVAAVLVFVGLTQDDGGGGESVSTAGATLPVVVAAQDIPAGTEITDSMLQVTRVPAALVVEDAYTEAVPAVGEVARVPILKGEQLSALKVGAQAENEGLQHVVPKGMRGVAVQVQQVTAVGGLLLPGNRVDVVAAFEVDKGEGLAEDESLMSVRTILQNVEVLAVAQEAQEPVPAAQAEGESAAELPTSGQVPDDVDEHPDASTVTLALDPGQVQILVSAQEVAQRVWLTLRPFGEEGGVELASYDVIIAD